MELEVWDIPCICSCVPSLTVWSLLAQLGAGEGTPSLFPVPAERGQGLPHPQLRKWHRPSASHSRTNTRNVQLDLSQLFIIHSYQQKNKERPEMSCASANWNDLPHSCEKLLWTLNISTTRYYNTQ